MTIRVTRGAAALISTWLVAAGFLVSLLFWRRWFLQTLLAFLAWSAVSMVLCTLYVASFRVFVGRHHISVRHGLFFLFTHRVPCRFVTGCHIWSSPLQRRMGSCILVLVSSGSTLLIPGAPLADAQALAARLTAGER